MAGGMRSTDPPLHYSGHALAAASTAGRARAHLMARSRATRKPAQSRAAGHYSWGAVPPGAHGAVAGCAPGSPSGYGLTGSWRARRSQHVFTVVAPTGLEPVFGRGHVFAILFVCFGLLQPSHTGPDSNTCLEEQATAA